MSWYPPVTAIAPKAATRYPPPGDLAAQGTYSARIPNTEPTTAVISTTARYLGVITGLDVKVIGLAIDE
jgi:hypothetical protein